MSVKELNTYPNCFRAIQDCPIKPYQIVVTPCSHIYCLSCLKDWVKTLEKPCPLCRAPIYIRQSSKDFPVMWKIFLKILKLNPDFVYKKLEHSIGKEESCSMCLEEFPAIPVKFDAKSNVFYPLDYEDTMSKLKQITVKDVVNIIQDYKDIDPDLKTLLTAEGPSVYERIKFFLFG